MISVRPLLHCTLMAILVAALGATASGQPGPSDGKRRGAGGGEGQGEGRMPTLAFRTEVPAHPVDVILGRPTRDSVVASVLSYEGVEGYFALGEQPGRYTVELSRQSFPKDQPVEVLLPGLQPNTRYFYRFRSRPVGAEDFREIGRAHV